MWIIRHATEKLFWSDRGGWGDLSEADRISQSEYDEFYPKCGLDWLQERAEAFFVREEEAEL